MTLFDLPEVNPRLPIMRRTAVVSDDGQYRYRLGRDWGNEPGGPAILFIMLNPSIADASIDDPTIRRCIGFARREGCTRLEVVNLFAFRTPEPKDLLAATVPIIGPDNEHHVREALLANTKIVVAGWGAWLDGVPPKRRPMPTDVVRLAGESGQRHLFCLGTTASGAPRHPLYLKETEPLVRWR